MTEKQEKLNKLAPRAWHAEKAQLKKEYAAESENLKPIYAELKILRDIQFKTNNTLRKQPEKEKEEQFID